MGYPKGEKSSDPCVVLSHSVMSEAMQPHGLQPARLLCPWGFPRQEYWSGLHSSRGSSQPRSPSLQVDSLPSEPPGKSQVTPTPCYTPDQFQVDCNSDYARQSRQTEENWEWCVGKAFLYVMKHREYSKGWWFDFMKNENLLITT